MSNKIDYTKWTKEELVKELKKVADQKKYGIVWEDKPEDVAERCKDELPVLFEDSKKSVVKKDDNLTHLLIEGDNYHALSVLNYTHKGQIDLIYIDPPYNTGAKDWKYNNNYVDINDAYRHSKWLSMMANRLKLAKNLLKRNGVLVCAIDENEHAHLGVLLEELFPSHEIHSITIVHNPRGVQGKNFSYTHEYAYFVLPQGQKAVGNRKIRQEDIKWRNLRDNGGESLRTDAKNCFYPIIVDKKTLKVTGFGEVPDDKIHPKNRNEIKDNKIYIWPIDKDGIERKWRYARQSVDDIKHLLKAKKSKSGYEIELGKDFGVVKTVWEDSRYDANEHGTKLIKKIVKGIKFDFPKSLWTVYDCIAPILNNKKDSIILDFFAGSGTTGHAVMELNKDDNGSRKFILCTNNENGISEEVTHPRIKNLLKGYDDQPAFKGNLKYYKTSFVPAEPTDKNKIELTRKATEMLCIKEGTFEGVKSDKDFQIFKNHDHYTGIVFDQFAIDDFIKEVRKLDGKISVYIFSLGDDTFDEYFEDMKDKVTLSPIPEVILRVYRRIFK